MGLRHRVTSRYLFGEAIANPKDGLSKFHSLVEDYASREAFAKSEIEKIKELISALAKDDSDTARRCHVELTATKKDRFATMGKVLSDVPYRRIKDVAEPLFWSIIQQYILPPKIRQGIEAASRFWSKTKMTTPRLKSVRNSYDADAEILEVYVKLVSLLRDQVTLAQSAIVKGTLNSDPELAEKVRHQVGSFTVVNTGGFDDKTMAGVVDVVRKAEKAMRGVGLGRVCYGDILITKTVKNNKNVAAFYVIASDEMFVRANMKGTDTVRFVCHELAHRLEFKFLQNKKSEIAGLYRTLKTQSFIKSDLIPEELLPKVNDSVVDNGKKLTVVRVDKYDGKMRWKVEGEPNVEYGAPIDNWLKMKGIEPHHRPDFKGFITPYAGKNPSENFAEMVSFYALGKLPKSQVALLEPVLA